MRWCVFPAVVQGLGLLLLVIICIIRPVESKQQACVVSDSILVPWVWPQVMVTSWVTPRNTAEPILRIKVDFIDNDGIDTYGILQLHSKNVTVWSEKNESISYIGPPFLNERELGLEGGWLNVTFEVKNNYTLSRTETGEVLFSRKLDFNTNVQEILINGSNVTVNCDEDHLIWRVFNTEKVVPLTPGGRGWQLGLFPTSFVIPVLTLADGVNVSLGLDSRERILDTNSTQPLQPFSHYEFVIECLTYVLNSSNGSTNSYTCFVKSQDQTLERLTVPHKPRSLVIGGETAKPFYFLQKVVPLPEIPPTISATSTTTISSTVSSDSGKSGPSSKGGKGGSGSGSTHKNGWSGWWAALAVILGFLLIFVVVMCFVSHYHRPKIEKLDPIWYTRKMSKKYLETMNLISEASQENLEGSPLPERRPLLARSCSIVVDVEDPKTTAPLRLWNAVASGEIEEVEQVLTTMTPDPEIMLVGWDTSPYEEAHRRGYHHILKILDAFMSRQPQLPDNDMIISVMQSHARNVEAVFEAARGGQYRHGGGVDVLLRSFSLPGTIHDQHGQSLLHYAASVKLADGGPLWLAPDIRNLVENHNVYVNAVDYTGQTALHALAEKASTSDQNTCWDGKAVNVGQAWVNLATLIMKLGCDSRLPDHNNRCPDEVARDNDNFPLADELAEVRKKSIPINYPRCLLRFKEFLESSKAGQVNRMQELLKEGVSVLPIGSRCDPLQEAIQGGHRDAVFLLLSAGAPLCAHGLVGDTPYEAAHKTIGLPALFPALVRRALCGQLESEMQIIRGTGKVSEPLWRGSKDIKMIMERSGHKLASEMRKWMEAHPVDNISKFNEMLSTSASLGLTLICQLLGVADMRINPLPDEQQPLVLAIENSHHNTVYSLCRDLKLNPYSAGITDDQITDHLKNDLLQSELLTFEKKLQKAALDDVTVGNLMNEANGISENGCVKNPSKLFLYLLAELSLVTLLHRIRKACDGSFLDTIVHEASGSTMLHIASAYGRINMVNYLLSAGAEHSIKTHGGLTASHLAASRGHKRCMQYLIEYTKHQEKWDLGALPHQILGDFEENVKSYHLDMFTTADLDAISNTKDEFYKAQLIISSRCEKAAISSDKNLWDLIIKEQKSIKDLISDDFIIEVERDVCEFLRKIMQIDSRFQGTIVSRNPVFEKTEFFLPETFEFFCELDDYHALKEGCISVGKIQRTLRDGDCIDNLKSTKEQELFKDSNFKHTFYKVAKQALSDFKFKTLALVPPFLHHNSTGITILGVLRKKVRINLIQVKISPVLKIPCLPDQNLRKKYQNQLQSLEYEHMANNEDRKWVYLSNYTYKSVLSSALSEEEQMVLWTLMYFCKLLSPCWWLPKRQQRRIGCTWQLYPVGVDFPSSRDLIGHFFDELVEAKEGVWKKENYLDMVMLILRRAMPLAKRKVSFRDDESSPNPPLNSISAVIAFLEKLIVKNELEVKIDCGFPPRKFGKFGNAIRAVSKNSLNVELEY